MMPRALFFCVLLANLSLIIRTQYSNVLQIDATCLKTNGFCVNVRPCPAPIKIQDFPGFDLGLYLDQTEPSWSSGTVNSIIVIPTILVFVIS
jgi:hypothetical protein